MNRINEYAGRMLAMMSAFGLLEKSNLKMKDLDKMLIDQALNFDICKIEDNKRLDLNRANLLDNDINLLSNNIELLNNLYYTWLSIYDYKSDSKLWTSDILLAYEKGRRDIAVHSFLKKTKFKYNVLGFFEDEFKSALEGTRMLSEDRYKALFIIFDLEKNNILEPNKILAIYRILMQYAAYSDLKALSNRWLCNYSISDILKNKIDLNNLKWEYEPL